METTRTEVVKYLMWEIGKSIPDFKKEFDRTVEYIYDIIEDWQTIVDRDSACFSKSQGINYDGASGPGCVVFRSYNYPLNETSFFVYSGIDYGNICSFQTC
jgi:glyceraldehyde-3-phosphate dehydrogenase (NADP+)